MSEISVQQSEKPTAAFVLSLLAGLWMLSMGGMMSGYGSGGMMNGWHAMDQWHNMGQWHGMGQWQGMNGWMWGRGMHAFGLWWPWFGILAGVVVVIGAAIIYFRPQHRRTWGAVILVVSAIDFLLGMGGLLAGALGVIGGAMAMA